MSLGAALKCDLISYRPLRSGVVTFCFHFFFLTLTVLSHNLLDSYVDNNNISFYLLFLHFPSLRFFDLLRCSYFFCPCRRIYNVFVFLFSSSLSKTYESFHPQRNSCIDVVEDRVQSTLNKKKKKSTIITFTIK